MEKASYKVEYLITVDQKEAFCGSINAFKNFLSSIDGVFLKNNDLEFGGLSLGYEIQSGEITKDKLRYFHLKLVCADDSKLNEFESFLRYIRSLLHKANGKPPQILWDGMSFNFAHQAYPLMHEIENTMRKLITKFMLINVGLGWTKEAIPKEVVDSVRSKDAKNDHNYLYEVDFIQLSNFLFKEYSTISSIILIENLRKAKVIADLDLNELKQAIPKSNWDRYFSSIVKCDSEFLRVRWEKLYDRRNQIAHNRPISRVEFEEIQSLHDDLNPKLRQAIEHLDQVVVSEDEKEVVSENAAVTKSQEVAEFLSVWNMLHRHLFLLASTVKVSRSVKLSQLQNNIRSLLNIIKDAGLISKEKKEELIELLQVRNILVHHSELVVPDENLAVYIEQMIGHIVDIKILLEE